MAIVNNPVKFQLDKPEQRDERRRQRVRGQHRDRRDYILTRC